MKIILKNLKQIEYELQIESNSITVKDLKIEIEKLYSFDSEQIKLLFKGSVLDNSKHLSEYNITENSLIIMMNTKPKQFINNNMNNINNNINQNQNIAKISKEETKQNISDILNDNLKIQIDSLVDMGFERSQVEIAVRAANGRVDLAVEYLNNGIPNNVNDNRTNNNNRRNNIRSEIMNELKKQANIIKVLCKNDKYYIFTILNNIKRNDPGLLRLITDYRDEFEKLLDTPITEEDEQNYKNLEAKADNIISKRLENNLKKLQEKAEKEKKEKEDKDKEKEEKEGKEGKVEIGQKEEKKNLFQEFENKSIEFNNELNTLVNDIRKGTWMRYNVFKNCFNNFILFKNMTKFKHNLNIDNIWYNYEKDIFEENENSKIIFLQKDENDNPTQNNNPENILKEKELYIIFEPNSEKITKSVSGEMSYERNEETKLGHKFNDLNNFVTISIYEVTEEKSVNKIKTFTLKDYFNVYKINLSEFQKSKDSKNFFINIQSGLYPFGFNLEFLSNYYKLENYSYNQFLIEYKNYHEKRINIIHPILPKGNFYLIKTFRIEFKKEDEEKNNKIVNFLRILLIMKIILYKIILMLFL